METPVIDGASEITDDMLERLELSDVADRALIDLVHTYRAARAHFGECEAMIRDELLFHKIN